MRQVRETMRAAVAAPTYGEGMHVLVATFGTTALANTPAIQFHFGCGGKSGEDEPEARHVSFRKIWNQAQVSRRRWTRWCSNARAARICGTSWSKRGFS